MRISDAIFAAALFALPATAALAHDDGFWRSLVSTGATSASSYLTSHDDHKLIGPLADDAGSFVASAGELRGPYLEAELLRLRNEHPELQQRSDMELANAILAEQGE